MTETSIPLCTVISEDQANIGKLPVLAKRCCQACAWREEQLRHVKDLKLQTSPTDKLLQNVADKILPPPLLENDTNEGLVRKVTGPLTERQIKYGNILSHVIQCKTVSYDEPHLNEDSKLEFIKLHKLLKVSFPILYEKYPPRIVNDYSLVFNVPGEGEGREKKPIMLCAHLDVVPAPINDDDDENGAWGRHPFSGDVVDGIVWGRGAIDNKHNVVAQLGALEEILSSGKLPKRTLYITCGHDEEIGGLEGAKRIAKLLEEDNLNFEFILDEGTMMISGAIPGYKEGPIALIGCAEKGAMNIEMTVTGPGGHSSVPPIDKDNPLKIMSKAIVAMESNPLPAHFQPNTLFRSTLEYVANKLAFPLNLICSNFWLFGPLFKSILLRASNGAAASIRTTTAVTKIHGGEKINAIPSEVKAYVNHRLHPSDSFQSVIEHDRSVINDDRVKLRIMKGALPASPISDHKNAMGFAVIRNSVQKVFGFPSAPCLCVGNTDTAWYWKLSENIYRFAPVPLTIQETSMFHGINERIGVDALTLMVDFYKEIISCD